MNLELAIKMCKTFEGFKPKPYLCPAGIPTIGYGSIAYESGRKVTLNDVAISERYAEDLLMDELMNVCVPGVIRLCPVLLKIGVETDNWDKFNAIVDFCYNLGVGRLQTSTLRRKINEKDWASSRSELLRWVRGGGKILPGLVKRRQVEAEYIT